MRIRALTFILVTMATQPLVATAGGLDFLELLKAWQNVGSTESIGGNAGRGYLAINMYVDKKTGEIVAIGNYQMLPKAITENRANAQVTVRVPVFGHGPVEVARADYITRQNNARANLLATIGKLHSQSSSMSVGAWQLNGNVYRAPCSLKPEGLGARPECVLLTEPLSKPLQPRLPDKARRAQSALSGLIMPGGNSALANGKIQAGQTGGAFAGDLFGRSVLIPYVIAPAGELLSPGSTKRVEAKMAEVERQDYLWKHGLNEDGTRKQETFWQMVARCLAAGGKGGMGCR